MIFKREKTKWTVPIQSESGETVDWPVESYWSPDFDGIKESVAHAACAAAWLKNKKEVGFKPVGEPVLA